MNPVALPKSTSDKQPPQKTTQPQPQSQPQSQSQSSQSAIPYYYEGNVQLMEARFLELCSSIRALYRSVGDLREYLLDHPGDDDALLLLQSICENRHVLRKHRAELDAVVEGLKHQLPNGKETFDVPDDIRIMVFFDDGKRDGKSDGPTMAALSGTENENEDENENENENEDEGPGVYL